GHARNFFNNISTDNFTRPQWVNLFQINEPVYRELVWEFFASIEFDSVAHSTRSGLRRGKTVKADRMLMKFWPSIGDGDFIVGAMAIKKVRNPKVRLAHRYIMTTISSRKEGVRDRDSICGGMFVTRIARSFGLLTNAIVDALNVNPLAHVFKKKYLIAMGVVMEFRGGTCCWPTTCEVGEDDEVKEAAKKEAGGSADVYQNMSQGDW
nr:hypothetical protein [Tanacetum cinerariifolium]